MKSQVYLRGHWYADIYEQQVTDTEDIAFLLQILGGEPRCVLEVACGGGRILVPLAKAGHDAHGMDADPFMLERLALKAAGMPNIRWKQRDIVKDAWDGGFDVAVLAGNILINILSDVDNEEAQQIVLRKAADAIKPGGHLYLDFDCFDTIPSRNGDTDEWVYFEGTDDLGTYGKFIVMGSPLDVAKRNDYSDRRLEITPRDRAPFAYQFRFQKHFPPLSQVQRWLFDLGLTIEALYGDYDRNPVHRGGSRVILWARKEP